MSSEIEGLETLRDFIRWGASRFNQANLFFGHGTDNALDEATHLVLHQLHLSYDLPPNYLDARLTPDERSQIARLFARRIAERLPAAYLTNEAWFAGLSFYVNQQVLVPRSPMAELLQNQLQPWIPLEKVNKVLDLCCGSGCIGIAAAHYFPDVEADLADISSGALEVARVNVNRYDLADRVQVLQSDLFSGLDGRRYDVILCNPPYVSAEEMAGLPPEYLREPAMGLVGGEDGLDLVRQILRQASCHLNPWGVMFMEVGNTANTLIQRFPEVPFLWLEFDRGGDGVFTLSADQLAGFKPQFEV